jgi:hypothetical protein
MGANDDTDVVEELTDHPKVGFNPEVCKGCPHRGGGMLKRCGLCGCPTISNMPMDLSGRPPSDCVRLDEHERRG